MHVIEVRQPKAVPTLIRLEKTELCDIFWNSAIGVDTNLRRLDVINYEKSLYENVAIEADKECAWHKPGVLVKLPYYG